MQNSNDRARTNHVEFLARYLHEIPGDVRDLNSRVWSVTAYTRGTNPAVFR